MCSCAWPVDDGGSGFAARSMHAWGMYFATEIGGGGMGKVTTKASGYRLLPVAGTGYAILSLILPLVKS